MEQWYENNRELFEEEIRQMSMYMPNAQYGFLPNGKMYWRIELHQHLCGKTRDWVLLAVYDSDHPQKGRGGTIKIYPVKPNYEEMLQRVAQSGVVPQGIPHLMRDREGRIYFSAISEIDNNHVHVVDALRNVMRWITVFEIGLMDQESWTLFHGRPV